MKLISWHKDLHLKRSREIAGVLIGHGWDCALLLGIYLAWSILRSR